MVKPSDLEGEDFRKHLFPDPLGQALPHGTEAVVLSNVEQERDPDEGEEDEGILLRLVLDLLMVSGVVDGERAPHAVRENRLDGPREDRARAPHQCVLPLRCVEEKQPSEGWHGRPWLLVGVLAISCIITDDGAC
jgi:hypothetical protein